jgi:hypothetical protein
MQPLLIPKGRTRQETHRVRDRMKHPRLNGADLYVARFGGWGHGIEHKPLSKNSAPSDSNIVDNISLSDTSSFLSKSLTPTGSLHDELVNADPPSSNSTTVGTPEPFKLTSIHSSRPCYRCVSYMHSVGIKRVFWTKNNGEWEGAKLRDLADALDGSAEEGIEKELGNVVFVTKHEVLMIKRMMDGL